MSDVYAFTSPEYENHANDTEAPLWATEGDVAEFERRELERRGIKLAAPAKKATVRKAAEPVEADK